MWGSTPMFATRARQVLDINFGSPCLIDRISNWRAFKEALLLDHWIVSFELRGLQLHPSSGGILGTWEEFDNNLERIPRKLQNESSQYELELKVTKLNEAIIEAYKFSCPVREQRSNRNMMWWNSYLSRLRANVKRLFIKVKLSQTGWQICWYTPSLKFWDRKGQEKELQGVLWIYRDYPRCIMAIQDNSHFRPESGSGPMAL